MTKVTTAPAASLQETWQAARERLEARRNVYHSYTEAEELQARLEGRTLPPTSLYASNWRPPETAAEYFDDRIIERGQLLFSLPETPVLAGIAAAAREGADAAVLAVQAARTLDGRTQWVVYQGLMEWKHGKDAAKTGAERIVNAVLSEWSKLKLAETQPTSWPRPKPRR